MRAGRLNRRIQIEQPSQAQDEFGQPLQTWDLVLECQASIRAVSGKEIYATSGFTSQLSHTITIRRPVKPIGNEMRVRFGDRAWSIQAASNPDEGTRQLNLMCLEIDGGAPNGSRNPATSVG